MNTELAALECLKIVLSPFFSVADDKIRFKLACNEDIHVHNILNEFKFQVDWTSTVS